MAHVCGLRRNPSLFLRGCQLADVFQDLMSGPISCPLSGFAFGNINYYLGLAAWHTVIVGEV
jgi:hypothetical protein